MTPAERYINATGAAFDILKSDSQLSGAIFGEVAMTCLVTMVVLLVAVNHKTKSPLAPFLVGCTVIINILAGWEKRMRKNYLKDLPFNQIVIFRILRKTNTKTKQTNKKLELGFSIFIPMDLLTFEGPTGANQLN